MDVFTGLAEALPPGLYTGPASSSTSARRSSRATAPTTSGCSSRVYLAATDLDTCERIVFGRLDGTTCRSRRRSSASTALPMVYRPSRCAGRQLIDGGISSTTNVDVAVEQGAKFIVVINPLVPYVNDFQKRIPTIFGSRVRRVSDMGYPQVGYQAFKLLAHAACTSTSSTGASAIPASTSS